MGYTFNVNVYDFNTEVVGEDGVCYVSTNNCTANKLKIAEYGSNSVVVQDISIDADKITYEGMQQIIYIMYGIPDDLDDSNILMLDYPELEVLNITTDGTNFAGRINDVVAYIYTAPIETE